MVKSSILLNKINNRKIIKNLGQFVSIIIITLLAVCLAVGLNSSAQTLEKKLDLLLDETNFADGYIYGVITEELFKEIEIQTHLAQRRLELEASIKGTTTKVLSYEEKALINMPYTDNYESGVYISSDIASRYKLEKGDTFNLSLFSNSLGNIDFSFLDDYLKEGKDNPFTDEFNLEFEVSGVMYHSEAISETNIVLMEQYHLQESFSKIINEYFTNELILIETIEYLLKDLYTTVVFKGDVDSLSEFYYDSEYVFVLDSEYNKDLLLMRNDITQAYQLTYVFPVIFIIVSILIIITTISQLIFKEKLNIATLKSIGISNKEIYMHYILLTMSLCLIGGVIGALIGPMIIPSVMGIKYGMLYKVPDVSNVYSIFTIFSNIFLFVIISFIVSFFILRKSVNTLPAVLIQNKSNKKFKVSKIKIKSWSLKIALRNISQNVFRSLMVIIGVGGCGALFITGFGIDDTLNNTVDLEINSTFNADATINFNNYSLELSEEIKSIEEVTLYEEYSVTSTTINNTSYNLTNIYLINDDTKIFNSGNFGVVYIDEKTAENLNIEINDTISFTINYETYEVIVSKTIGVGLGFGVYIPKSLIAADIKTTNAWIKTTNQSYVDSIISEFDGVSNVETNEEFLAYTDSILGPIGIIKITLQVFAILLGIVVLYNLALLNFKEKARDIATLKVLGLTNVEIAKSLMYEMMILAVLGGLFGLAIGYPMLVLLLSINEVDIIKYLYNLRFISYLLTFLFTTFTALVINLFLFKQIDKIKMVESLKSVE